MDFRTVLSLNKATSSKKIQTCSCCKYRGFSDFQPQNLTLKMWQKFGSFWLRQLNKSGWCNYLFILFPTQLKSSIQLDAAWGSFMHHRSLGLCLTFPHDSTHILCIYDTAPWPLSCLETPPVKSEWCMGPRSRRETTILFDGACDCPEGSVQKGAH